MVQVKKTGQTFIISGLNQQHYDYLCRILEDSESEYDMTDRTFRTLLYRIARLPRAKSGTCADMAILKSKGTMSADAEKRYLPTEYARIQLTMEPLVSLLRNLGTRKFFWRWTPHYSRWEMN